MATQEGVAGGSILVVDDDPVIRTALVLQLEALDHAGVREASDGLEALAVLAEVEIDLVITDLMMPGLDGLGLMRSAREHGLAPAWIILSGVDTFAAAVEAIQLGAFDFISKPAEIERLRVAVGNALEHRALVRERDQLNQDLERRNALLALELEEMARLNRTLEDQAERLQLDLERAEVIQRALLPPSPPALGGFRLESIYRAGRHVGGDLYDVSMLNARQLMLLVADASGHGVSSAMVSVLLKHRLRTHDPVDGQPLAPATVLTELNRALHADISQEGMFATAVYGVLDTLRNTLTIASAGHPPVLVSSGGKVERIRRTGPALGLDATARYRETVRSLEPGARILVYTDGVQGSATPDEAQALLEAEVLGRDEPREALQTVLEAATASAGDDPDDITMVLVEARGGESHLDHEPARPPGRSGRRAPHEGGVALEVARGEEMGFARLLDRCTWVSAPALHVFAGATLASGKRLVLDLTRCSHLDSTLLGTLHEIVRSGAGAGGDVVLQGVSTEHRQLFEELSMDRVLAAIRETSFEPPGALRTPPMGGTRRTTHAHILRAHEALASLSDSNREEFHGVIEDLRRELEAEAPGQRSTE